MEFPEIEDSCTYLVSNIPPLAIHKKSLLRKNIFDVQASYVRYTVEIYVRISRINKTYLCLQKLAASWGQSYWSPNQSSIRAQCCPFRPLECGSLSIHVKSS